jgi:hypothetical protein
MSTDPSAPQLAGSDAASLPASPEARLQSSRAALRTAMLPQPSRPGQVAGQPLAAKPALPLGVDALLAHPVVQTARDTVRQWWRTHPLRPVITVGVEAASQMMVPLARRHPGRLLAGAMLAGALLSRWRPWKWIIVSAVPPLLASMLPTLISRLATRIPVSTLLKLVGSSAAARNASAASAVARADPARRPPAAASPPVHPSL